MLVMRLHLERSTNQRWCGSLPPSATTQRARSRKTRAWTRAHLGLDERGLSVFLRVVDAARPESRRLPVLRRFGPPSQHRVRGGRARHVGRLPRLRRRTRGRGKGGRCAHCPAPARAARAARTARAARAVVRRGMGQGTARACGGGRATRTCANSLPSFHVLWRSSPRGRTKRRVRSMSSRCSGETAACGAATTGETCGCRDGACARARSSSVAARCLGSGMSSVALLFCVPARP